MTQDPTALQYACFFRGTPRKLSNQNATISIRVGGIKRQNFLTRAYSMFIRHSSLSCFLLIMSRQAKSKKPKVPQSAVSSQTQSSFMSQTRQNNDVFATASVSQHQAPLQRTSPCDNTLKIQQTQKNESDTSTPTTPTKRPSSPLIAYVQSLSPVKRSKKRSLLYFGGSKILVTGSWSLVTGHWSLVAGPHWSLVAGHWSLVTGYWSLVTGHWSLVTDRLVTVMFVRSAEI